MTAVWIKALSDIRSRWRSFAGLGLIAGLIAGVVLAAVAGARRTDSAYGRFAEAQGAADVAVYGAYPAGDPSAPPGQKLTPGEVTALPQVAAATVVDGIIVAEADLALGVDPGPNSQVNRLKLVDGRRPRSDRTDEVLLGFLSAQRRHLRVGSTLDLHLVSAGNPPDGAPPAVHLRVVGIEAGPGEFPPSSHNNLSWAWVSRAFLDTPAARASPHAVAVEVRLRHGAADLTAFSRDLQSHAGDRPATPQPLFLQAISVQRAIHLQAVALWLVAGLAGTAGALVLAQLLVRQLSLPASEHPALRSLGMTTPQLWGLGMVAAAAVAAPAAVTSAGVAIALSPLTPIGVARLAEPRPGLFADALVLGLGVPASLLGVVALSAGPAWLVARRSLHAQNKDLPAMRPSALGSALARLGAPPSLITGVRLALEPGRGRSAVPVRTSHAAGVLGLASLVAALTFAASAAHLLATPRLYGVAYDADILATRSGDVGAQPAIPTVGADASVEAFNLADTGIPLSIDGVSADGLALGAGRGSVAPPLLEGHQPEAPDEIVLGSGTFRAVGARIGSDVTVSVRSISLRPGRMRVVGRAVLPSLSDAAQLGRGAVISREGMSVVNLPEGFLAPGPSDLLVRFVPGTPVAQARARLQQELGGGGAFVVVVPAQPTDMVNFGGVRSLPLVLAIFLAALAAATITHLSVTSVGRRLRDFAVLKALGFTRRQVTAAVGWQATTVAAVAIVAGLPLGLVAGRWAWRLLADQLGVVVAVQVPWAAFGLAAAATVVVANAMAAGPGLRAGRLPVSVVLRDE